MKSQGAAEGRQVMEDQKQVFIHKGRHCGQMLLLLAELLEQCNNISAFRADRGTENYPCSYQRRKTDGNMFAILYLMSGENVVCLPGTCYVITLAHIEASEKGIHIDFIEDLDEIIRICHASDAVMGSRLESGHTNSIDLNEVEKMFVRAKADIKRIFKNYL